MRFVLIIISAVFIVAGCDNVAVDGPMVTYRFSTQQEFTQLYLPLQDDHGGIKSWLPSKDRECSGGKVFTLADDYRVTFCPFNGDGSLFK